MSDIRLDGKVALIDASGRVAMGRPGGVPSDRLPSAVELVSGVDPVAADGFPAALLA